MGAAPGQSDTSPKLTAVYRQSSLLSWLIREEDPDASAELVLTPSSTTHHFLHLLPEAQVQGLAAQLIVPQGLGQPVNHFFQSLAGASNTEEADLPCSIPQQESMEGYHSRRTSMVASCPSLSNLLPYLFRQRNHSSYHRIPHEPSAALVLPRGRVAVNNRPRDHRGPGPFCKADIPPPPSPPSPGTFPSQHQLLHLICLLERRVNELSRQLTRLMRQLRELERQIQMLEASCGECVLRITNVAQRRGDAILGRNTALCSAPFYYRGYKMCFRVYLSEEGTHLSVFLVMMKGEYDDLLQWPFAPSVVTFTLLDQSGRMNHLSHSFRPDPSSSSFQRPQTNMSAGIGLPQFAPLVILQLPGGFVINDDTLYIRVKIMFYYS